VVNSREGLAIGHDGSCVRTRGGGLTWPDVAQPGATGWRRMQFLPGADTGSVISESGTLFKSTDRGATWLSPVAATSAIQGLATMMRSTVWRWARLGGLRPHDLIDVRLTSSSRGYAVGAGGTLLSTTDGG
jgi:photosystem II stability/assembly factor-like uncharacterized protein